MKVLVAEDEYYTRKAIVKMVQDWSEEVEVTDDVENGKCAVQSIERVLPDVVITDIRMPGLDGLELCEYVKNTCPSVFLVVVSGYAEFEYAQKAIAYDVKDYLLKPLNKELLFKILDKLRLELEKQESNKSEQNALKKNAGLLKISQELDHILYGQNAGFTGFKDIFHLKREPEAFILGIMEARPFTEKLLIAAADMWSETVFPFYRNKSQIGIIYASFEKNSGGMADAIISLFRRSAGELGAKLSCHISAGIGGIHRTFSELPVAYREAEQALNYRLIHGWGRVFEYNREKAGRSNAYVAGEDMLRCFSRFLEEGEKEEAKLIISKAFCSFLDNSSLSVGCLQQLYLKIIAAINDRCRLLAEQNLMMPYYAERLELGSFCTMDELFGYISSNIELVCNSRQPGNRRESEQMVEDLKRFVAENYHTSIVLEELAEKRYFINVCYLSKLFKSITGESFSRYLVGVRMAKAKQLIEEGNMKISDIAGFVGYNAVSHFVQVFKKHYGVTPGEYKSDMTGVANREADPDVMGMQNR